MLAVLLVQAAVVAAPTAASPRTLSGRFVCGAHAYDVAITATPADPARAATLDRLTVNNRAPDPVQMVEITRAVGRLSDIRSLDLRCLPDGGELSLYGVDPTSRRARIRARVGAGGVRDVGFSVEQPRR
ncbi:hypothetical protein M0208_14145 [Sphingomonas sp. SUN019]|uniref:hypothetical protein n=1 Tax=Sphingomonas sp. SUN019 TaxID=2937788 RepID=UPI0021647433|nr:hypothetical protein [Sphingomonas sp. SUN019]UVO51589.1 hypothetical protein M0208_14145 [Sphingomonas sp. SUN019]